MAITGYRDGIFRAKALQVEQKRFIQDNYQGVLSSADALKASVSAGATTAITLGTTLDYPRTVKIVNNLQARSERVMTMVIKGYTGQGQYAEEQIDLSLGTTGRAAGNVAFAYITNVVPLTSTKGFGTYSTVSIYPTNVFGVTEYCENSDDVKEIAIYGTGSRHSATTGVVSTTTFDVDYQTIDLTSLAPQASTLNIKYISKFQKKIKG